MSTNSTSAKDNNKGIEDSLVLVVTLVCLTVSLWQTGNGYAKAFGHWIVSFAVAFTLVAVMFIQNGQIRRNIQENKKTGRAWLLYGLCILASFAGNFNSFYSKFTGSDLVKQELSVKRDSLESIGTRAGNFLVQPEDKLLQDIIDNKVNDLRKQIINEGNPGLGPLAIDILAQIERELKMTGKFTKLKAASKSRQDLETLADEYEKMIKAELDIKLKRSNVALKLDIERRYKLMITDIDQVPQGDEKKGLEVISKAVNEYKKIGNDVQKENPSFIYDKNMQIENNRLGEIDHSIKSVWANWPSTAIFVAIFLSLMIDLLPPLLVHAVTQNKQTAPPRKPDANFRG